MCGIFAYIGKNLNPSILQQAFMLTANRGPDDNTIKTISKNLTFGFHRLSIMDKSFKGNQPLWHPNRPFCVICNGEIYNFAKLVNENKFTTYSGSDCEVILYLYEKYGIEGTIKRLDSESFAFCLYDGEKNELFVARDRYGVRPLFISRLRNNKFAIASEAKSIIPLGGKVHQFKPSNWKSFKLGNKIIENKYIPYHNYIYKTIDTDNINVICKNIRKYLTNAVSKRMMSDRPIGCLLSGGLDSSLISALVAKQSHVPIHTFAIGMPGSPDLEYAQKVADHIGSIHHSVELPASDFLDAIEQVIKSIESYDITTVRASVGNYLIGKYIKENTNITVVFNGDGSDEQSGYKYLKNAPNDKAFKEECIRLLKNINYFDALRSDRCMSTDFSLETRSPFLDTEFVNYYMSIPTNFKTYYDDSYMEKHMLRMAFECENLIPDEILWRPKEAFSDGCSDNKCSWHKIIENFVEEFEPLSEKSYEHNTPFTAESKFYRTIFEYYYPNQGQLIPYFWMPKWSEGVTDPSAREL